MTKEADKIIDNNSNDSLDILSIFIIERLSLIKLRKTLIDENKLCPER